MVSTSRRLQLVLQVVLGIVIVVLAYVLIVSIVEPYAAVERRKEITENTRTQMNKVRTAMILYQRENGRFVSSLDSLVMWVNSDSTVYSASDSIFGEGFVLDSLIYSPRTGKMFELAVNDTSRVKSYLLSDPDSDDYVGTLGGDITQLNAASWE